MRRLLKPVRRTVIVLLIASFLVTQPAKPAHAFAAAIIIAAVAYVGDQLLGLFTGDGKLKAMLLALETELPIMLTTVEMKLNENIAKARAAAHKERVIHENYNESRNQYPADVLQANCQMMTGIADVAIQEAHSANVYTQVLMGENQNLQNRGSALSRGGRYQNDRSLSTDPIRQKLEEYNNHVCRYATKNDLTAAIAAGCKNPNGTAVKTLADIEANPYRAADTNAATILASPAFDEDRHYLAAQDYCYALTGNQPLNYAEGRALTENLGNIRQFLDALSDKSARNLAYYSCQGMIRARLPLDSKFVKNDPALGKLIAEDITDTVGGRTSQQISDSGKKMLRAGLGYTDVNPSVKVTGEPSKAGQSQLINGQMISLQQNREAVYVARFMAGDFANKQTGNAAAQYSLLLWSRVANLQLLWRQYEELERQTLTDAIELARLVRSAPVYGDPPASARNR